MVLAELGQAISHALTNLNNVPVLDEAVRDGGVVDWTPRLGVQRCPAPAGWLRLDAILPHSMHRHSMPA